MPNHEKKGAEWMRHIGSLGGKASGIRRSEKVPTAKRHLIAVKGARARWGKPKWSEAEEAAWLGVWQVQLAAGLGLPKAERLSVARKRHAPDICEDARSNEPGPTRQSVPLDSIGETPVEHRPVYNNPFIETIAQDPEFSTTIAEFHDKPKVQNFLIALGSLKYQNWSITRIAARFGLGASDLAEMWRDSQLQEAFFRIVSRMPDLAEKVMDDALGAKEACPRCDGLKNIEVPEKFREFFNGEAIAVCPNCDGMGTIQQPGSAGHVRLIWDALGWSRGAIRPDRVAEHASCSLESFLTEIDELDALPIENAEET